MTKFDDKGVIDSKPKNRGWFGLLIRNPDAALMSGSMKLNFNSMDAVQQWVEGNGMEGISRLRIGLQGDAPIDEKSKVFARLWLEEWERKESKDHLHQELRIAADAALAAQKAAKWAKYAAIATAVGAIFTAASALVSVTATPPQPQVFLLPSGSIAAEAPATPLHPK